MAFFPRKVLFFCVTASIGICAGLAAAGFQYSMSWIFHYGLVALSSLPFWLFSISSLSLATGGALVTGILMAYFAPDAPGSGIPQVQVACY